MKAILRPASLLLFLLTITVNAQSTMAFIQGGDYIPLYGRDSLQVSVSDIHMDIYPVTNEEFLSFVQQNPQWSRSKAKRLFVDENYLAGWEHDTLLGAGQSLKAPVTNISWFAAKAYCECQGKRLPTVDEWEYVGMANEKMSDARILSSYNKFILSWYEKPKTFN
ncbi:MAG: SUMF1/EgtB/PvdO family nonheme iron enzyme, partial [Lutibacter sp.]|nr:SUMF1/EgtB/PvdO family nonheme iron enzyme [Lutibacter sp.]